jgi:hypothetical protein
MDLAGLSVIFLTLVLFSVLIFVLKSVIKALTFTFMLFALVAGVYTYFLYQDIGDFKQNWESEPKLFLLHDKGYLLTGFKSDPAATASNTSVNYLTIPEMDTIKEPFSKEEYDKILGKYDRIFIIDIAAFENVDKLELQTTTLTLDETKRYLTSPTPTLDLIKKMGLTVESTTMQVPPEKDAEMKGMLFAGLFSKGLQKQGPLFLIEQLKAENIVAYPSSLLFTTAKNIPLSWLQNLFKESVEMGKEGITAAAVLIKDTVDEHKEEIKEDIKGEIDGILG